MRMLIRLARAGTLAWAVVLLAACGGSEAATGPEVRVAEALEIITHPGDSIRPVTVFPDSMAGAVTDDLGTPMEGVLVNLQEFPADCVRADAYSLQTNGNGRVFFELTAGETAVTRMDGPCVVRLVRSRKGRADLTDSVAVTILPGPPVRSTWPDGARVNAYDTLGLATPWEDTHGNPILVTDWHYAPRDTSVLRALTAIESDTITDHGRHPHLIARDTGQVVVDVVVGDSTPWRLEATVSDRDTTLLIEARIWRD